MLDVYTLNVELLIKNGGKMKEAMQKALTNKDSRGAEAMKKIALDETVALPWYG
jgi:hypothetical protein